MTLYCRRVFYLLQYFHLWLFEPRHFCYIFACGCFNHVIFRCKFVCDCFNHIIFRWNFVVSYCVCDFYTCGFFSSAFRIVSEQNFSELRFPSLRVPIIVGCFNLWIRKVIFPSDCYVRYSLIGRI